MAAKQPTQAASSATLAAPLLLPVVSTSTAASACSVVPGCRGAPLLSLLMGPATGQPCCGNIACNSCCRGCPPSGRRCRVRRRQGSACYRSTCAAAAAAAESPAAAPPWLFLFCFLPLACCWLPLLPAKWPISA